MPVVAEGGTLAADSRVADSGGLGAYVYDAKRRQFELKQFVLSRQ